MWLAAPAQPAVTGFVDVGQTRVSEGIFIKPAVLGSMQIRKFQLEAGLETHPNGQGLPGLSGLLLQASAGLVRIGPGILKISGFMNYTGASKVFCETNIGGFVSMEGNHFACSLGIGFHTYAFTGEARTNLEISQGNAVISEIVNPVYSFRYTLPANRKRWDLAFAITNRDFFLINQAMNPLMELSLSWQPDKIPVRFFAEGWAKLAGLSNFTFEYFGFTSRIGARWNLTSNR